MKAMKSPLLVALLMIFSLPAGAHPLTYKGGQEIISNQGGDHNEFTYVYTAHQRMAAALSYQNRGKHLFRLGRAHFLLHRENRADSQGNLWLQLGAGTEQNTSESGKSAYQSIFSVDWESRSTYLMFEHSYLYRQSDYRTDHIPKHANDYKARWGFAPFIGQYDELNIWFMAQLENKAPTDRVELIPFLRFYYKEVLWEIGQGFDGHSRFQFMIHL